MGGEGSAHVSIIYGADGASFASGAALCPAQQLLFRLNNNTATLRTTHTQPNIRCNLLPRVVKKVISKTYPLTPASFALPHCCLWKRPHQKINNFIRSCDSYPRKCAPVRKSASQEVLSRTQLTLHATRRTRHGASRWVHAICAWLLHTRRAPSRHCGVRWSTVIPLRLRPCMKRAHPLSLPSLPTCRNLPWSF